MVPNGKRFFADSQRKPTIAQSLDRIKIFIPPYGPPLRTVEKSKFWTFPDALTGGLRRSRSALAPELEGQRNQARGDLLKGKGVDGSDHFPPLGDKRSKAFSISLSEFVTINLLEKP